MGIGDGMLHSSILWMALLFINDLGFVYTDYSQFFILTTGMEFLAAAIGSAIFGASAAKFGSPKVIFVGQCIVSFSMLLYIICRWSTLIYCVATIGYSMLWCVRILRVSLVVRLVRPKHGLMAAAIHQNFIVAGCFLGPALWYLAQLWQTHWTFSFLFLNRFAVVFIVNFVVSATFAALILRYLGNLDFIHSRAQSRRQSLMTNGIAETTPIIERGINLNLSDESLQKLVNETNAYASIDDIKDPRELDRELSNNFSEAQSKVRKSIAFFFVALFLFRVGTGTVITTIQPIVVNRFKATDSLVAWLSFVETLSTCSMSWILSFLSSKLSNRQFVSIVLALQLLGISLMLPIFPTFSLAQAVAGFIFVLQATISYTAACVSMLSKVLGPLYKHSYAGYIWVGGMLGMAAAQGLFVRWIVPFIGTWAYAVFLTPVLIVVGMFCSPWILSQI